MDMVAAKGGVRREKPGRHRECSSPRETPHPTLVKSSLSPENPDYPKAIDLTELSTNQLVTIETPERITAIPEMGAAAPTATTCRSSRPP